MIRSGLILRGLFSNSIRNDRLIVSQQRLKKEFKIGDKPELAYGTRHIVFPEGYKPYKLNFTTDVFMWGTFALFYFFCFSYLRKYQKIRELDGIPSELQ